MLKSAFFFALYGAIAGVGWYFYDSLENDGQPIAEIQQEISSLSDKFSHEENKTIYRWKNAQGNWEYGTQMPSGAKMDKLDLGYDYQKELAQLKSLPKGTLPLDADKIGLESSEEDSGSGFIFPGIPDLKQVAKLLQSASDIRSIQENRKEELDHILENR